MSSEDFKRIVNRLDQLSTILDQLSVDVHNISLRLLAIENALRQAGLAFTFEELKEFDPKIFGQTLAEETYLRRQIEEQAKRQLADTRIDLMYDRAKEFSPFVFGDKIAYIDIHTDEFRREDKIIRPDLALLSRLSFENVTYLRIFAKPTYIGAFRKQYLFRYELTSRTLVPGFLMSRITRQGSEEMGTPITAALQKMITDYLDKTKVLQLYPKGVLNIIQRTKPNVVPVFLPQDGAIGYIGKIT